MFNKKQKKPLNFRKSEKISFLDSSQKEHYGVEEYAFG